MGNFFFAHRTNVFFSNFFRCSTSGCIKSICNKISMLRCIIAKWCSPENFHGQYQRAREVFVTFIDLSFVLGLVFNAFFSSFLRFLPFSRIKMVFSSSRRVKPYGRNYSKMIQKAFMSPSDITGHFFVNKSMSTALEIGRIFQGLGSQTR